ncbi:Glycosyltransferase [Candidatus Desulfarcum epimagneticum]|uniref:Glycosyltransferase n=1 Tax=uncultured Desulfobacteraceae bacterium TaxID=218296 RepID=A0A484HME6_9BACT|nr:Glycosyltransferase [uncultured Desulfobacteraceae bacterium]
MAAPLVTVVIPSLDQGVFLEAALESVWTQDAPVEIIVMDGGSRDASPDIIRKWESRLLFSKSAPDRGQSAAINEGMKKGSAPYVCWLNSDDTLLPRGLSRLARALDSSPRSPAAYGKCRTVNARGKTIMPYITAPFSPWLLARYCFIAQPASLIRRSAWEGVGGLDESLHMAMDYDLWWRLFKTFGAFRYVRKYVAATRAHSATKTVLNRHEHYREAIRTVLTHTGKIPLKWRLSQPFMRDLRDAWNKARLKKTKP